jgi:alkylation response protein AidB-like acyl-CoA dehydrogenase
MELTYTPEAEAFRSEIRGWLEEHLPQGWFEPDFEMTPEERRAFNEDWPHRLYEGGWICASWPEEYGGKGLSILENVVLAEEFARAKAPLRADFFGDTLVGPTILQWGTEEQKKEFLPKIQRGEMRWCQGFSEPDSGSDLASLKTTAVQDGDEWVINGQKVWTTQAQYADYIFLLARTDPAATKHHGISYLLVPMEQDGIHVRPITQPDGTAEFNEVFFDDARCPLDNVVGGINNGWVVANTTLAHERGMSATTSYRRFEEELDQMTAAARERGLDTDPLLRQRLAACYTKIQILRINGLRSLSAALVGRKDPAIAALGASNKMFWSEMHRDAMELALDLYGADGMLSTVGPASRSWPGNQRHRGREQYPVSPMVSAFFFSRSETIWGGTAEIQRNIVGERVLGLPREPKPAS